ncbi:hypothetical protein, partial [Nocardioides furvisabuli]|uniref:hypothetical protein n=1 Tax=Nocardioides furvisabuli TaxID=375542 RepID=UPI001E4E9CDB
MITGIGAAETPVGAGADSARTGAVSADLKCGVCGTGAAEAAWTGAGETAKETGGLAMNNSAATATSWLAPCCGRLSPGSDGAGTPRMRARASTTTETATTIHAVH